MDSPAAAKKLVMFGPTPTESQLRWTDVTDFLRRYWLTIGCVFLATVITAYATLSLLTEKYDTSATILVKMGRENLDPPPTVRNQNVFTSGIRREEVLSEIQFLQSRDLIERTVRDIGVEPFRVKRVVPPDFVGKVKYYAKAGMRAARKQYEEALYALNLTKRLSEEDGVIAEIADSLQVVHQKDTDVISLQLRMGSPEISRRVLDSVISKYMLSRIEFRQSGNVNAFLEKEAKRLRQQLDGSEAQLAHWKKENGLSATRDQKTALIQQVNALLADRDATEREIRSLTYELEATGKLLPTVPETVKQSRQEVVNPAIQGLRQRLVALQSERAHMLTKFQPESETMVANTGEIERIQNLIRAEIGTHTESETIQSNPLRQELIKSNQTGQVRLAGLKSRASVQATQIEALRAQLAGLESADFTLTRIERQKQIDENQYLEMLRRRQEADIAAKLDLSRISNVTVLSPPTSTFEPVYPRKLLMMAVALGLGLMLGLGLAMLLAYMDDTIYGPDQVETAIGVPLLGSVTTSA